MVLLDYMGNFGDKPKICENGDRKLMEELKNNIFLKKKGAITSAEFFSHLGSDKVGENPSKDSTYDYKFFIPEENNRKKIDLLRYTLNIDKSTYYESDNILNVDELNKTLGYAKKYWEEFTGMKFSDNANEFIFEEDDEVKGRVSKESLLKFYDKASCDYEDFNDGENNEAFEFYSILKLLKSRIRVMSELSKNGEKQKTKDFHNRLLEFSESNTVEIDGGYEELDGSNDFGKVFNGIFAKINQTYVKISHRSKKVNSCQTKAIVQEERMMNALKDLHGVKVELNQKYLKNVFVTLFSEIARKFDNNNENIEILEVKNKNWLSEKEVLELESEMKDFNLKVSSSVNKKSSPTFKSFSIVFSVNNKIDKTSENVEIQFNPLAEELVGWDSHQFYKLKTVLIAMEKITGPNITEEILKFQINKFLEENKDFGKTFEEIKERLTENGRVLKKSSNGEYIMAEKIETMTEDEYIEHFGQSL